MYWLTLIMRYKSDGRLWLCPMTDSFDSLEKAKKEIKFKKENFEEQEVISAWVDVFENDIRTTVFHECYLNFIGGVDYR